MRFENRNYAFAGAFVEELARCGLRHVCICPGSRSSPLAISFARQPAIKTWVHLDERSASFFALGMARSLGEPVALVCSSGTASANFYPAIAEARNSLAPIIVLTADRPPEISDWGALQTIDQVGMYGTHAKWSVNMPPPEATRELMAFVRSTACRAFTTALEPSAGPVHVNFPFRDPLEPAVVPNDFPDTAEDMADEAWHGRADNGPYIRAVMSERQPVPENVERLAADLASTERGVIICGPQSDPELAASVSALAKRLSYPVLAEPLSQVRCGTHDRSMVVDCYDAFLRDSDLAAALAPEVVIRFGALPTTKTISQYLERHRAARHIMVDTGQSWNDPLHVTSDMLRLDPVLLCNGMVSSIEGGRTPGPWASRWRQVASATRAAMKKEIGGFQQMFEGKVFSELARFLPEDATLFAGNSMPVRDMDTFFPSGAKRIRFMTNRGASGIDGVVSTALGASAVGRGKLVLVIGDISFYHDMNGLLAAKAHGLDSTIIVINNDGGGIFSFLPQAAYEDVFETYFGTSHGLTFRATAELYNLGYRKVEEWRQFQEAVAESLNSSGTDIIEIPGDRALNVTLHRRVWAAVAASVQAAVSR
ncbi:MAG: 2-succinyl-5-enolpyruvyl-6-hydroxy-3-cyclohexene-1-carboxylic-acid synthase [Dehalococcoidia bacterium]|nr:2-succinyl-5-enolpyruvyl-6-hydroxy-3-cyclohexene-1-carboxylic-acid synthase [Dehalococcoidia bacterium]